MRTSVRQLQQLLLLLLLLLVLQQPTFLHAFHLYPSIPRGIIITKRTNVVVVKHSPDPHHIPATKKGGLFPVRPATSQRSLTPWRRPSTLLLFSRQPSSHFRLVHTATSSLLVRSMYQLPSGNNNNNDNNELMSLLQSVGSIVLILAILASPVGGFLLAMFNSILLLSFVVPLLLVAGFQIWQYFNTISGPCPQCGAPLRLVKNIPSICMNCGSLVETSANADSNNNNNNNIQVISNLQDLMNDNDINNNDEVFDSNNGWPGQQWMDGYFGVRRPIPRQGGNNIPPGSRKTTTTTTIIDVTAEDDK